MFGKLSFFNLSKIIFHIRFRYNIGHIGISLGDLGLAYQAFKVAVSVDPNHGEALNNIAVLEMRRQKFEIAKSCLASSCEVSPYIFEPFYNSGNFFLFDPSIDIILPLFI